MERNENDCSQQKKEWKKRQQEQGIESKTIKQADEKELKNNAEQIEKGRKRRKRIVTY